MPDPDPVAALAAQLEVLRRQLADYTGETGHLRARMEQDAGQVLMLLLEVKQLREQASRGERQAAGGRPAGAVLGGPEPRRSTRRRLAEVRAWVERVACVQWPGYMARLAPCWAEPPGGGLGAVEPDDRMGPGVRRPGEPPAAGRPVVL